MRLALSRSSRRASALTFGSRHARRAPNSQPLMSRHHARFQGNAAGASTEGASTASVQGSVVAHPSRGQLLTLALASGTPFIGFGFADNFIMIVIGDQIDGTLGTQHGRK